MKAKAFRAAASAVLLGPATCSGSMVKYDTSLGEFKIQCPAGSYCLVSGIYPGAWGELQHGSPPDMEEDDRFDPLRGFHWLNEEAVIRGQPTRVGGTNNCVEGGLEGLECQATCDEACVCQREVNGTYEVDGRYPSVNDNSPSCPILETFPNHSVTDPSEYVLYESSAQWPDRIEVICEYPYGKCSKSEKGGGKFGLAQSNDGDGGENNYSSRYMYSNCDNPDGPCYAECPPQCTCTATDGNSTTEECKVAVSPTPAPTAAATEKPTSTPTGTPPSPSSAAPAVLTVRAWTSLGLSIFGYIFVNKLAG